MALRLICLLFVFFCAEFKNNKTPTSHPSVCSFPLTNLRSPFHSLCGSQALPGSASGGPSASLSHLSSSLSSPSPSLQNGATSHTINAGPPTSTTARTTTITDVSMETEACSTGPSSALLSPSPPSPLHVCSSSSGAFVGIVLATISNHRPSWLPSPTAIPSREFRSSRTPRPNILCPSTLRPTTPRHPHQCTRICITSLLRLVHLRRTRRRYYISTDSTFNSCAGF